MDSAYMEYRFIPIYAKITPPLTICGLVKCPYAGLRLQIRLYCLHFNVTNLNNDARLAPARAQKLELITFNLGFTKATSKKRSNAIHA